jgi:hypothetical protein
MKQNEEKLDVDAEKKQQPSCDVDASDVKSQDVKNGDAGCRRKPSSRMGRISHGSVVKYSRIFKKVSPDGNLVPIS